MDIEKVKKEIVDILIEELKETKCSAFFFGSRVTGTATERSDLDVGIEFSDEPVPTEIFSKIKSRCEAIRTLYSIDVVDFYYLNEEFKKVAKSKIEIIK
jgi:predicted nucleotidyltransferase